MPLPDYVKKRQADPNDPLKLRAARAGLTMVHRDRIPSTRRAHEASEWARTQGKLEEMNAALLTRYWTKGEDLYQLEVLRAAAQEAGLDPDELQRVIEAGTFTAAVEERVRAAQELGVRAVPTFVVGDKFAVEGAQEYPVFEEAMRRLGAQPRG